MNHTATNVFSDKTPWFYIVSIVGIYLYIYLHFMCLYYSCYHLPRRMGLFWSGALLEDSKQRIEFLLSTSPHIGTSTNMLQPLSPLSRFATNIFTDKTQLLSLIVFFERTQTKTNNFTLSIYLRSQYTLFAKISLYFPSIHTSYNTVPNYHRQSLLFYRPDQIEQ